MEQIILVLKGFLIGIAKIIPGVSGGMIAISLGLYEKGIDALSHFFQNVKGHIKFLFFVGIGIALAIVFGSKFILFALQKWYLPTMLLFIGLILGGLPALMRKANVKKNKISDILVLFVCFFLMLFFFLFQGKESSSLSHTSYSFVTFFLIGVIEAVTMIVPGISGTAILMLLGYYETMMGMFSGLSSFSGILHSLPILFPFGLGILIGAIAIIKLVDYLLHHHEKKSYYGIIGFALSSALLLLKQTFMHNYSWGQVILSLILLVLGYFFSKRLDKES